MKAVLAAAFLIIPTQAIAHPGHLAEVAGHAHWLGLAAAALAAALAAGLAGRPAGADDAAPDDAAPEGQEA